ncbi:MAG: hypothetical protein ACLFWM_03260 [Actinomycetota bacterium]
MVTEKAAVEAIHHRRREVGELLAEAEVAFLEEGEHLADCLTRLAEAIGTHASSQAARGFLSDVVTQAPRLSTHVDDLVGDHLELPTVFHELSRRMQQIREDAATAFERLAAHQRLADHLVYEAFATDLGGDG